MSVQRTSGFLPILAECGIRISADELVLAALPGVTCNDNYYERVPACNLLSTISMNSREPTVLDLAQYIQVSPVPV